jgi:hypothetical protein
MLPVIASGRGPKRGSRRGTRRVIENMPTAMGRNANPVARALKPRAVCRNWVRKKNIDIIAAGPMRKAR